MALTVSQTPSTDTPAFSDQWFKATSNQLAQANFRYQVVVTLTPASGSAVTRGFVQDIPPDNYLCINVGPTVEDMCKSLDYIPFGNYGWKLVTNGLVKVAVAIQEWYGTPAVVQSTDTTTYYAWNGVVDYLDFVGYSSGSYLSDLTTIRPLNSFPDSRNTRTSMCMPVSFLSVDTSVIQKLTVKSYSSVGVLLQSSDINNPFHASANWYDRYISIDCSYNGLYNIPAGQVTGTHPCVDALASYYVLDFIDDEGDPSYSLTITPDTVCSKSDIFWIYYINKNGAWDYFCFDKISDLNMELKRTSVKHIPYSGTSTFTYAKTKPSEFNMSVALQEGLRLRTDHLTETQSLLLKQLVRSPIHYLKLDTSSDYIPVLCTDTNYRDKRYYNEKLFQLELNVKYAHENKSQKVI